MILRSLQVWLVPLVLTFTSICSDAMRATAQTIYPFTGNYRTTVNIEPISGNVSKVFEVGLSDDAPYDLGLYEGLTYSVLDANGNLTFNNNPEVFGVQGFPQGYIVFGSNTNKLFGTSDASASVNFENLTAKGSGVVNITDGEGIFKNATSTLLFSEEDIVNLGSTITLKGQALVSGSIEVPQEVLEPTSMTPLISIGLIGASFIVRRRYRRLAG
ncbi:hypothetical protein COO91_07510 [Nostoc flagelliforme CCNUN1]|uniref:PEP-CTERM protein-sorting domain n=1 Tax=Nostoc flagelliforme CCNUN1 TaxID=2038116 RepID=A0A2K8T199_9NOSO|nr:hypothetical protein [Nostoc flagelliforme]AUB41462.1 hypothetical protein COO91_07510 [Nostoc flagelliforme CCNUN1]